MIKINQVFNLGGKLIFKNPIKTSQMTGVNYYFYCVLDPRLGDLGEIKNEMFIPLEELNLSSAECRENSVEKFHECHEEQKKEIFKLVRETNRWPEDLAIIARPDYSDFPIFRYYQGEVSAIHTLIRSKNRAIRKFPEKGILPCKEGLSTKIACANSIKVVLDIQLDILHQVRKLKRQGSLEIAGELEEIADHCDTILEELFKQK